MRDFLPEEAQRMRYLEAGARTVAQLYRYQEIITPILESYKLLAEKAGEEIRSRMYAFKDLGGRRVALRPEFTASVARLVAHTLKNEPKPLRIFCAGSLYRYDEPQQGRFREFWQSNYELMGSSNPEADAETIMLTNSLISIAGLENCLFKVGHVGVLRGILNQENIDERLQNQIMHLMDKREYNDALKIVERADASRKCLATLEDLIEVKGREVSEILNSMKKRVEEYEEASLAVQNLQEILRLVVKCEENTEIFVDAGFARGLEYYTGMVFEIYVSEMDVALGGGGRYDKLIELFGGKSTPAVGVAHGLDRIMIAMEKQRRPIKANERKKVMVIPVGEEMKEEALEISQMLRNARISVEFEVMGRRIGSALQDADRRNMDYAVIVGKEEQKKGNVVVRDLKKREQKTLEIKRVVEEIGNPDVV